MAKKRKSKSSTSAKDDINGASASSEESVRKAPEEEHAQKKKHNHDSDSDDDSSSDDDSLVLEGVLMRNPDASSSSSDDEYNEDISSEEDEEGGVHQKKKAKKQSNAKSDSASSSKSISNNTKMQNTQQQQSKKKKKKQPTNEPETIQVEFLFCDMNERYFHGIKTLLHRHGIHAPHSSQLSDLIIENEMVGTVLSTDDTTPSVAAASAGGNNKKKAIKSNNTNNTSTANAQTEESNVFGFASIINVTTNHSSPAIQSLKKICLKHCPTQHKSEMETVLSGRTKRPAGFFIQERMVNVPLEITYILHEQLVLDMDYAINNADDEIERKSLDFGAFVRLAPCYKSNEQVEAV